MRADDIEPGRDYGRAQAGRTPFRARVISVTPLRVSYIDDCGRRGYARPNEITGLWAAHETARRGVERARDELVAAAGDRIQNAALTYRPDRAAVAEDNEYQVLIRVSATQAHQLAEMLRTRPCG